MEVARLAEVDHVALAERVVRVEEGRCVAEAPSSLASPPPQPLETDASETVASGGAGQGFVLGVVAAFTGRCPM